MRHGASMGVKDCCGKPEEKIPRGRHRNRCENNIKMFLKIEGKAWTEFIWLGIVNGFHKMGGISGLGEEQLSSQEGLCSTELAARKECSRYFNGREMLCEN
jgi:hypothetical protein